MRMEEVTRLANLPVYTRNGTRVGVVKNLLLNLQERRVEGVLLTKTNPEVVEGGRDVCIPYRWVQSFSDILLLRYFPEKVTVTSGVLGEGTAVPGVNGAPAATPEAEPAPAEEAPVQVRARPAASARKA